MKLTFERQCYLGAFLFFICALCGSVTEKTFFFQMGWVFFGALFLFHPVVPPSVPAEKRALSAVRIMGAVIVLLGLWTRFG